MILGYNLMATWGPRPATPEACATHAVRMFAALGKLHPALARWQFEQERPPVAADSIDPDTLARLFAHGQNRESSDGEPLLSLGYDITAWNGLSDSLYVVTHITAGGYSTAWHFANVIDFRLEQAAPDNASLLTVDVLRSAVMAVVEAWDATWCDVSPFSLHRLLPRDPNRRAPRYHGGWLTYIAPRFASLIRPPASAITEHPPGGGVLMIATEERFDVDEPKHVRVARDIHTALAPLNALPWPPDSDVAPETVA